MNPCKSIIASDSLKILRTIAETPYPVTFEDAVKSGNVWLVHLELESATDYNKAFRIACSRGHTEIVRLLLDRGVNPSAIDNYALRWASRNGHTNIVRLLLDLPLEKGADAFRDAYELGHTEIVRLLLDLPLDRGVDPAISSNDPIRYACERGYIDIVRLLLELPPERGVNPTARGEFTAIRLKNNEWVEFHRTAFDVACIHGHTEIFRLLLNVCRPGDHGVHGVHGYHLIRIAIDRGFTEIVQLLQGVKN